MNKTILNILKPTKIIGQCVRNFSVSSVCAGKRNFGKFVWYGRGTEIFKRMEASNPDPDLPRYNDGVREVGYKRGKRYIVIPEKIPEIVVPDLTGFLLQPYVSYRVPEIVQEEFTANDLFDAIYRDKIINDYKANKLDADGNPLEPSANEQLTPQEASNKARKTGCDLFDQTKPPKVFDEF